jgi:hypothetical protein
MGQIIQFPSSSGPRHMVAPAMGLVPAGDRACAERTLRTALLAARGSDMALGPLLGIGWPMQRIRGLGAASLAALMAAQRRLDRAAPPRPCEIAAPCDADPALVQPFGSPSLRHVAMPPRSTDTSTAPASSS